ncbi:hypothetical protein NMG60_11023399, partial [Bertholletia excelsa]
PSGGLLLEEEKTIDSIADKEPANLFTDDDFVCSSLQNSVPRLMPGKSPPPFLKKIYEMVEDPETDHIISWSNTRKSFIIWNYLDFSSNLLHRYFRHNNFSSFIYQLNTYGFKKISWGRWEYANEWFQKGKKHLLVNIKRRSQQRGATLSRENGTLKEELENLRKESKTLQKEVTLLKECLRGAKRKLQVLSILLHQLSPQKSKETEPINGAITKKSRLVDAIESTSNGEELSIQALGTPGTPERLAKQNEGELEIVHSEAEVFCSAAMDDKGVDVKLKKLESFALFEKLWEDDAVSGTEPGDDRLERQSEIVFELEDLIEMPLPDWAAYVKDLTNQVGM